MCGICGSTSTTSAAEAAAINAAMVHRGPDDDGIYTDPRGRLSLGARRLSIIDLAGGHQPLRNEDGTVWAALNGEIYNSPSLQEHLRGRGHRFHSHTDTETLVHLYEEYGDDLVHALEGMFAFAVWDETRGRLLLARDRFGEKPMFVRRRDRGLVFASELTALLTVAQRRPALNLDAVDSYMVFGYVPGPETIVEGVTQLPPGHLLTWEAGEPAASPRPYWSPRRLGADAAAGEGDLVAETRRLLERSIARTLVSDVPVGVFLSGGVDSGLIAALVTAAAPSPPPTFTVGYDVGEVSEFVNARQTAAHLGTDHHELVLDEADVARRAVSVLARIDQPLADPALIPLHAVSELARRHVKVVVGGEGADELFGGYPRYRWLMRAQRLEQLVPAGLAGAGARALSIDRLGSRGLRLSQVVRRQSTLERSLDWVTAGRRHQRPALYGPALRSRAGASGPWDDLVPRSNGHLPDLDPSSAMELDQRHWLPDDVLFKADRAGMLNSLEIRTPYLARELAEFANGVPTLTHLAGDGKALLRAVLRPYVDRPGRRWRKTAFRVPGGDWLRRPLAPALADQIRGGTLVSEGLVDREFLHRTAGEHAGGEDRTSILWPVLALGLWLDQYAGRT
ncbi:MAG: asparagine synthase (glutamine-hydrolyzing) [Solirubrobacteraceae bacterium]